MSAKADWRGLACPACGRSRLRTYGTVGRRTYTRRSKECLSCGKRFYTREEICDTDCNSLHARNIQDVIVAAVQKASVDHDTFLGKKHVRELGPIRHEVWHTLNTDGRMSQRAIGLMFGGRSAAAISFGITEHRKRQNYREAAE